MTRITSLLDQGKEKNSLAKDAKKSRPARVVVLSLTNVPRFDAERRARYEAAAKSSGIRNDYPSITLP